MDVLFIAKLKIRAMLCNALAIVFSKHAESKFEVLKRHGIIIDRKVVEETVTEPDLTRPGIKGVIIAEKVLDEYHLIRVIHARKNNDIRVITFYPARRRL